MTRELMFLASAVFGSVALVAAYLYMFHAEVSAKEVGSTAAAMMFGAPKRLIRWPVKKPGANIPITCHSITNTV